MDWKGLRYKLLLGDCLTVTKEMDSESVDCIITSPPYWGMRKYDQDEDAAEVGNEHDFADYVDKLTRIFTEAKRLLKKEGSFWLNIGDKYNDKELMGMPWRVAIALMDRGGVDDAK